MIIIKLIQMRNQKLKKSASNKSIDNLNSLSYDPSIKSFQITAMLLSIALAFLVFTSPISIYMAFIHDNITYSVRKTKRELIQTILRYIAYFNNAVNFYIYFFLSSEFRREFLKTLGIIFKVRSLTSCTRSTDIQQSNKQQESPKLIKMGPRTKPIYRGQLEFTKYKDSENAGETLLNGDSPRRGNGVEKFKKTTRKSPLVHYANKGNLALNHDLSRLPQTPFINSQPTEV